MTRHSLIVIIILFTITLPAISPTTATNTAAVNGTNPTENTWIQKATMPTARNGLEAAEVDGKIYAIGGYDEHSNGSGVNQMYDPETNTWTTKAPMPTARIQFALAVYQGKIYCFGGTLQNSTNPRDSQHCAVNEVYDPATDTWTTKAAMPSARWLLGANTVGDKIYLIGGLPDHTLNEAYDPATDTYTTKASLQYSEYNKVYHYTHTYNISFGISVSMDNQIVWFGSVLPTIEYGYKKATLLYNPENDSWTAKTPLPGYLDSQEQTVATTGTYSPKLIYVFGSNVVAAYNPKTDTWKYVMYHAMLSGFGAVACNDKIYLLGGTSTAPAFDGKQFVGFRYKMHNINDQYTPLDYGTVPPAITATMPQNSNFAVEDSLVFSTNKPVESMSYSLDGQSNATFAGNLILAEIPLGAHNLTVYATDTFGNIGASETICFTVKQDMQMPFPIILVGIAVVAIVVIAGLVVYSKKYKRGAA
jgi:N-acetylneuraminic acid mutarotase